MVIPIYSRTQRLGWHTIRAFQQLIFQRYRLSNNSQGVLYYRCKSWLASLVIKYTSLLNWWRLPKRHGKPSRIRYIRAVECETPTSSQIATAVTINRIFEVIPSHMTSMGEKKYNRKGVWSDSITCDNVLAMENITDGWIMAGDEFMNSRRERT